MLGVLPLTPQTHPPLIVSSDEPSARVTRRDLQPPLRSRPVIDVEESFARLEIMANTQPETPFLPHLP